MKRFRISREAVWILAVFVLSVLFRLWFITLAPQPFWWDQQEYENYAQKMMHSPFFLASHTYRTYPYPLMMALLYTVFGFGNHQAIFFVQAVLDALTGVLVYLLIRDALGKRSVAWGGFLLYAVNPFTSGYVGLALTEVVSAFLTAATVYAGVRFIKKPGIGVGILLGFLAGMVAETRNAAFAWAAIPIGLTVFFVAWKRHLVAYAAVVAGLTLTVLYPMYVNWRDYRELSVTTVDSITARELYNGAVLKILPPFTRWYPPEVHQMYVEYYSEYYPNRTTAERKAMADKYYGKFWDLVKQDPTDYIRWRFFKMWYVWQKENIFFITEPGYESHRALTYTLNLVLLLLAVFGLIAGWLLRKTRLWRYLLAAVGATAVYGTLVFSLTHAEYRLTIPFYPLVLLSAACGVWALVTVITRLVTLVLKR